MIQQNEASEGVAQKEGQNQQIETQPNLSAVENEGSAAETPKEASVVQEQPNVTAAQPIASPIIDDQNQVQLPSADEEEIKEELSSKLELGINVWTKKAKDVIDKHQDQPYTEDEEEEKLQVEYLKQRFGVEVNMKEHKIK
jgi:hypothetical protein